MKKILAIVAAGGLASAAPVFAGFDHIITFEEAPIGTDADGLVIANAEFAFKYDFARVSGAAIGGGPGVTPNTSDPGIEGPTDGILGVRFLKPVSAFGFGAAFSTSGYFPDALSVSIYDPEGNFLTKISMDADSPIFRGDDGPVASYSSGYVGESAVGSIGSLIIDFSSFQPLPNEKDRGSGTFVERFLFDNLGYDIKDRIIPLPSPAFLGGAGLIGVAAIRRRRGM